MDELQSTKAEQTAWKGGALQSTKAEQTIWKGGALQSTKAEQTVWKGGALQSTKAEQTIWKGGALQSTKAEQTVWKGGALQSTKAEQTVWKGGALQSTKAEQTVWKGGAGAQAHMQVLLHKDAAGSGLLLVALLHVVFLHHLLHAFHTTSAFSYWDTVPRSKSAPPAASTKLTTITLSFASTFTSSNVIPNTPNCTSLTVHAHHEHPIIPAPPSTPAPTINNKEQCLPSSSCSQRAPLHPKHIRLLPHLSPSIPPSPANIHSPKVVSPVHFTHHDHHIIPKHICLFHTVRGQHHCCTTSVAADQLPGEPAQGHHPHFDVAVTASSTLVLVFMPSLTLVLAFTASPTLVLAFTASPTLVLALTASPTLVLAFTDHPHLFLHFQCHPHPLLRSHLATCASMCTEVCVLHSGFNMREFTQATLVLLWKPRNACSYKNKARTDRSEQGGPDQDTAA
eukprot:1161645-Pelagomonas_calceolata.AAC.21